MEKMVLICRQEEQQSTVVPAAPRLVCRLKIHFLRQNGMETIEDVRQHSEKRRFKRGTREYVNEPL
jgi:hypothetical protein